MQCYLESWCSCLSPGFIFSGTLLHARFISGLSVIVRARLFNVQLQVALVFLELLSHVDTSCYLNTHNSTSFYETLIQTYRFRFLPRAWRRTGLLPLPKTVHLFHCRFTHDKQPRAGWWSEITLLCMTSRTVSGAFAPEAKQNPDRNQMSWTWYIYSKIGGDSCFDTHLFPHHHIFIISLRDIKDGDLHTASVHRAVSLQTENRIG